ncbi:MAG TPA: DUF4403 family protein [Labilithrix sp.]
MGWCFRVVVPVAFVAACSSFGAVYPPRPPSSPGAPVADPTPSRIVAHVTITHAGLQSALEDAVPKNGDGTFPLLRSERSYRWEREPISVEFADGRVRVRALAHAHVDLPIKSVEVPLDVIVTAEPILNASYEVKLQGVEVFVSSPDRKWMIASDLVGVFDRVSKELGTKLKEFRYDVRPPLEQAYARIAKPIELPIGDATGCAELRVLGVEAGPTVIADGLEKDVALIVAPSVTLPCAAQGSPGLPPLANVASVPSGPFTVIVPIAARYEELTHAMSTLFTDGKYYFSAEYPKLYLENPEVYESQGELVVKVHVKGPVHKYGIDADLDGDLFLSGHIAVVDNEVRIPDLEPTIETKNFFLSLKALVDGDKIRDQARAAMRLDLGERLRAVREQVSSAITFGGKDACFKGDLDKIEITSAHAHGGYLRAYVSLTARAAATMPCSAPPQ